MKYCVYTERLTKDFGKEKAVTDIDMKIPQGEIYGFLGPNGAGKTTTIRMLLGLVKPTEGTIHIFQEDLNKKRIDILKKVGSLVENPSYYPHLTAWENLEAFRKILGSPKAKIEEVLKIVDLSEVANKKVKGYSLGMKQRLGIAISLLNDPDLLILDEPTNGLDPSGIIEIRNLIKRLAANAGITILISSHLLSEIDQLATTVGVITNGRLIFQNSITEMRKYAQQNIYIQTNDNEKAYQSLADNNIEASIQEKKILLPDNSNDNVAQTVSLLVQHGFLIYRVEEATKSLEDIFLDMTKEEE